jgi:hypothetical protein
MAKTKISEYSSTSASNTDIANINIAEGCSPANVNNAIRTVMAQLKDQQDGTGGDPFTCSGTLTSSGTLAVTGALTLDGAAGTSGQVLTSAGSGTPTWSSSFVAGMIMMWSGTIATIPSGWLLCNGSSSTPDLRDKFIIGASADSGGAAKTNAETFSGKIEVMTNQFDELKESLALAVIPVLGDLIDVFVKVIDKTNEFFNTKKKCFQSGRSAV